MSSSVVGKAITGEALNVKMYTSNETFVINVAVAGQTYNCIFHDGHGEQAIAEAFVEATKAKSRSTEFFVNVTSVEAPSTEFSNVITDVHVVPK